MNDTNRTVINVVTMTLAALAVLCVATVCFCSYHAIQIPPELNTLTGGLVGALSAMLTKTTPTASAPAMQEVKVVNSPTDPVKTEEI